MLLQKRRTLVKALAGNARLPRTMTDLAVIQNTIELLARIADDENGRLLRTNELAEVAEGEGGPGNAFGFVESAPD
jgi:hypothetical protein